MDIDPRDIAEAATYRRAYDLAADGLARAEMLHDGPDPERALARLRAEIAQELGADSARALELIDQAVEDAGARRPPRCCHR